MDRTPREMREDALMWAHVGYPAVAVGRYRDAADQIQRLNKRVAELEARLSDSGKSTGFCTLSTKLG
jgi:hypothetical protein